MSEIVMGIPKKVGDSAMITDLGDDMLVLGVPDVAYNPVTKKYEKVMEVAKTKRPTTCPDCKKENEPGVEVTLLESGIFNYACPKCNQFVWCREKGK